MCYGRLQFAIEPSDNQLVSADYFNNLQLFYGCLDSVPDNLGEAVPEETFTNSHLLWSSIIPYLLPSSFTIHGILPVQVTCLTVFFHNISSSFLWSTTWLVTLHFIIDTFLYFTFYFFVLHVRFHNKYISSPNHCLLFAAHAHIIAACFAVVPKLRHLILVSHSTLYLELL